MSTSQTLSRSNKEGTDRRNPPPAPAPSRPSEVPESVPHFKSFDHITDERVRRAKDYEQYLQGALSKFPEFKARIETEISFARAEQSRSKASDRDRIFKLLEEQGELLTEEIAEDLELPYATAYKHLRGMLDTGLVKCRQRPGVRGNKPMLIWY